VPHKLHRYLVPVLQAVGLMVGWLWDRWITHAPPQTLRIYSWVWGGLAGALAAAVLLPLPVSPEIAALIPLVLWQKLLLVGLLLGAAVAVVMAARDGRPLAIFAVVCVSTMLVLAYETRVFVVGHNRAYGVKALSGRLVFRVGPRDQLVTDH